MDPIVHESYGRPASLADMLSHDIALLKLAEDVDLATYTPACLAPRDTNYAGKTASLYGWGKTKDEARPSNAGCPQYDLSPVLKETTQTIITNSECNQSSGTTLRCKNGTVTEEPLSYNGKVTEDMVCGIKTGTGTCYGDSGGPLTVEVDERHTLVGVSSWTGGCARVSITC